MCLVKSCSVVIHVQTSGLMQNLQKFDDFSPDLNANQIAAQREAVENFAGAIGLRF